MDPILAQHIMNWLMLGSLYTLVALGFSLLFGVLNVIHFSHGDVSIVAPFVALASVQVLSAWLGPSAGALGWFLALGLAIIATGLLGILLDWLIIRRFRNSPAMMALVATVALGSVLRELIRTLYPQGSNPKPFPLIAEGKIAVGGFEVSTFGAVVLGATIFLVTLLYVLLHHTQTGMRIRAVAEDRDTARLMSVNPNRVFAATFFIASAIGAVGGMLYGSYAGVVRFDFGIQLGLIGFSAAVLGGLGSMPGAILGSLLIAGIDVMAQVMLADGAAYRLVFVFLLVIAVLILKPSGMFGKPVIEKV
ncbi:branched-chain amino acid ABC transporter permease [Roseovarius sp. SK2]|uniref:branched-chain amino acid ABC transporter permease n=1 Tax=Roseovarius TaxID=74030 RepID=UPI00237A8608|nr:branched-chain amino acid ABC transporter permease [Roseovarius sp. SK2]MDD9725971.1 branched-chain amino acid ABC transporter permease [Roseovarius sp. SK2]